MNFLLFVRYMYVLKNLTFSNHHNFVLRRSFSICFYVWEAGIMYFFIFRGSNFADVDLLVRFRKGSSAAGTSEIDWEFRDRYRSIRLRQKNKLSQSVCLVTTTSSRPARTHRTCRPRNIKHIAHHTCHTVQGVGKMTSLTDNIPNGGTLVKNLCRTKPKDPHQQFSKPRKWKVRCMISASQSIQHYWKTPLEHKVMMIWKRYICLTHSEHFILT